MESYFTECQICHSPLGNDNDGITGLVSINCELCGEFKIDFNFFDDLPGTYPRQLEEGGWIKLSRHSRMQNLRGNAVTFTPALVEALFSEAPSAVEQQKQNLILYIGNLGEPGQRVPINYDKDFPLIGSPSPYAFSFILEALAAKEYLLHNAVFGPQQTTQLTDDGWSLFDELNSTANSSENSFMAMQFNNEQVKALYDDYIKPAMAEIGCPIGLLTEDQGAGLIDDQLLTRLNSAKFIIADVSDQNINVYWEAGYGEGQDKPVIYICERSIFEDNGASNEKRPPFDTNHRLHVLWVKGEEQDFTKRLQATVQATFPDLQGI